MATASLRPTSRYHRDQQIATTGSVVLLIVTVAVSTWVLYRWSTGQPVSTESAATPLAGTSAPPVRVTMGAWLAESERSINDLVAARNNIAAAAAEHDIAATGAACQNAVGAVANLHRQLPSPESALTNALQRAAVNYDLGLPYCISATQTHDGPGLARAASYISQGDAAMRTAFHILGQESGTAPRNLRVLIV